MIFVDQPINTGFSYSSVSPSWQAAVPTEPRDAPLWVELRRRCMACTAGSDFAHAHAPPACVHAKMCVEPCVHACGVDDAVQDSRDRVSDEHLVGEDMLDFLWEFYRGARHHAYLPSGTHVHTCMLRPCYLAGGGQAVRRLKARSCAWRGA